jgi:hypothetical protein
MRLLSKLLFPEMVRFSAVCTSISTIFLIAAYSTLGYSVAYFVVLDCLYHFIAGASDLRIFI